MLCLWKADRAGYKYFIEHKTLHLWLVCDGTLTSNPNEVGLLSFNEQWIAKKYLSPIEPEIRSDYTGRTSTTDYTGHFLSDMLKRLTAEKNNGADLYSDFIITEHEFISQNLQS
jgi:hypothetical protein